jgi:hypothetical protein
MDDHDAHVSGGTPSATPSASLVIGYLALRKLIGFLGMSLPIVLFLGGWATEFQGSMSAYYHTGMRDIFVGTLCAIGVFLFCYRGHDHRDVRAGYAAGTAAVGTALVRSKPPGVVGTDIWGILHLVFAAVFLLTLAYFSLYLFTLTDNTATMTEEKRRRNVVYRICGYVIVASIALLVIHAAVPGVRNSLRDLNPVFVLEEIAVLFFGISWITKGEAILADK